MLERQEIDVHVEERRRRPRRTTASPLGANRWEACFTRSVEAAASIGGYRKCAELELLLSYSGGWVQ